MPLIAGALRRMSRAGERPHIFSISLFPVKSSRRRRSQGGPTLASFVQAGQPVCTAIDSEGERTGHGGKLAGRPK